MHAAYRLAPLLALLTAACGASGPSVQPSVPTFADATGTASCPIVEGRNQPFIVDWPADRRAEIEIALRQKPVVVAYDCLSIRLLPDCEVSGSYGFIGTTEREQVISFETADELKANLPLSGLGIAGRLGAELARGTTLDLALALIGRKTTPRRDVLRSELKGQCEGASHFVRAASIGAFAMRAGARGRIATAADLFGVGVDGSHASSAVRESRDGSLDACRRAKPDATAEEPQCGAPLRLELMAIDEKPSARSGGADDDGLAVACPKGTVARDDGACSAPAPDRPHLCAPSDVSDCEAQCKKGSMASCAILGRSYELGRGVKKDLERAAELLTTACKANVAAACGRLGELMLAAKREDVGLPLLQRACADGWVNACTIAGTYVSAKPGAKQVDVFALFQRACAGGDPEGCWSLGTLFEQGLGVRANASEARRWYSVACEAGARLGCVSYAKALDEGAGATADPKAAADVLQHACDRGFADSCGALSAYYFLGKGVARDPKVGAELLDRACQGEDRGSCFVLGMRYRAGTGVTADRARADALFTRACEGGVPQACSLIQNGR